MRNKKKTNTNYHTNPLQNQIKFQQLSHANPRQTRAKNWNGGRRLTDAYRKHLHPSTTHSIGQSPSQTPYTTHPFNTFQQKQRQTLCSDSASSSKGRNLQPYVLVDGGE